MAFLSLVIAALFWCSGFLFGYSLAVRHLAFLAKQRRVRPEDLYPPKDHKDGK